MRTSLPLIALALTIGCSSADSGDSAATESDTSGSHPINGTELFVKEIGHGDPLLVIHGGPGMEHSYLLPGLDVLAEDARLIFFDQRGTGRSAEASGPESISMERFIEDIDGVREATGHEQVDVLAHSWGGLLGIQYAARYPERVRSLILVASVEPGQQFQAQAAERQGSARTPADVALIDSLAGSPGFASRDPATVSQLYWAALRPTFADRAAADRLVINFTELTARKGGEVAAELMTPLGAYDFWDLVAELHMPTLIVHGEGDPTPPEVAALLNETLPDSRLLLIEGAGHFPFIERPEVFRAGVAEFLRALADGR